MKLVRDDHTSTRGSQNCVTLMIQRETHEFLLSL